MRATINTIIATIAMTTQAYAANGEFAAGTGLLCWIFFGFCGMIVACQMVPAALMMGGTANALLAKPVAAHHKG